jgi:pilus assembly protein CpaB
MTLHSRRVRLGSIGFAALALACAAFAAYLVNRLLVGRGLGGERVRPVVVARRALAAAQRIAEADLDVVSWPERRLPPGTSPDIKTFFAANPNPTPTGAILEGEPVVPSRLASQGQGTGLAALVRDGHRAVAVKVDDAVGRSGLVYPGASVDVMATLRDPDGRGPSTRIAVSDARVLAVEGDTEGVSRAASRPDEAAPGRGLAAGTVVTLEVTPDEAEVISLAAHEGQIDLALRNGSDRKPVDTRGAVPTMFSAFAPFAPAEATAAAPVVDPASPRTVRPRRPEPADKVRQIETYHAR